MVNDFQSRQSNDVASLPLDAAKRAFCAATAGDDIEKFTARVRCTRKLIAFTNAYKACQKAGAGCGVGCPQVAAQIQRNETAVALLVEVGRKFFYRDARSCA